MNMAKIHIFLCAKHTFKKIFLHVFDPPQFSPAPFTLQNFDAGGTAEHKTYCSLENISFLTFQHDIDCHSASKPTYILPFQMTCTMFNSFA